MILGVFYLFSYNLQNDNPLLANKVNCVKKIKNLVGSYVSNKIVLKFIIIMACL
jgi:hypothetical protein